MFLFGFSNRLIGHPDLYFKGMLLSLVCNLFLNYILIAKLDLGIVGAAIATGMSYSSALLIVSHPLLSKKSIINVFSGTFDQTTILPVLYNGSSEGICSLSAAISAYIFNMAFMNIAGESGVERLLQLLIISGSLVSMFYSVFQMELDRLLVIVTVVNFIIA